MNDRERHLARRLLEIGAVKFGAFKLKLHETHPDAPLSPIYFNLRTADNPKPGPLGETELEMIGRVLRDITEDPAIDFNALAGVPNAGDPFARALNRALRIPVPVIKLRKEQHDGGRSIVGIEDRDGFEDGAVLVVDDLITGADSKLEAIRVLDRDYVAHQVLVLIDREQGGRETLEQNGVDLFSAFTMSQLLDFYVEAKLLDSGKRDEVKQYLASAGA